MIAKKNYVKIFIATAFFIFSCSTKAMFQHAKKIESGLQKAKLESKTQQKKAQGQKKCYDLMMIIDDFNGESVDSKNQAMGMHLIDALVQGNFPIIVSRNIVYNVCVQANSYNPTNRLFATKVDGAMKPLLYSTNLVDDYWYAYDNPTWNIMLFVPKKYCAQFADANISINEQMRACGFNTECLTKIDTFSPETLPAYITSNKRSMFSPVSTAINCILRAPKKPNSPSWNIYLTGHGFTNNSIAGLRTRDFLELLYEFKKINCSFLHYETCYSGGFNQNIVRDELSKLKVNYIVSAQGINEEWTYGPKGDSITLLYAHTRFFKMAESFFGNPIEFTKQRSTKESWQKDPIASIVSTVINKDYLDYTQPFVYLPSVGVFNALTVDQSVKIITNAMARAYAFENETMDFTDPAINTIIMYPHYVGVPLKIKDHVAMVSPTTSQKVDIHVLEHVTYQGKLSSMIPNFASFNQKLGATIFAIKKLQCFDYENSGLGNDYKNMISIENMVICVLKPERNFNIYALFNFDNKVYYARVAFEPTDEEDTSKTLFAQFKDMLFKEISQIRLIKPAHQPNDLLNDFMPYKLSDHLAMQRPLPAIGTFKTLPELVTFFESIIDTSAKVQEPGSLKRVLEQKQQHILEKEAQELALHEKKKQLAQGRRPTLSYVNYLKKLKDKIEGFPTDMLRMDDAERKAMYDMKERIDKEYEAALQAHQSALEQQSWSEFFADKVQQSFDSLMELSQSAASVSKELGNQINLINQYKKLSPQKRR